MQQVKQRLSWLKRWAALVMAVWAVLIVAPAYAQQVDQVIVEESSDSIRVPQKVAVDGAGNRYVTAQFNGDVTFGEGADSQAKGFGVRYAVGQLGLTVVGEFFGATRFIDRNNTVVQRTAVGGKDGFVAHYRTDGSLAVVHQIGSPNAEAAVRVIHNGLHMYVAGHFQNSLTIGATALTSRGQIENFLVKYNRITNTIDGVTQIGSDNPTLSAIWLLTLPLVLFPRIFTLPVNFWGRS
ncbi:MAG: hypothetical protein R3E79_48930 [Caldilineaceae bacterium]